MKTFTYKAIDKSGKVFEGEKTAEEREDIASILQDQSATIVFIKEKKKGKILSKLNFSIGSVKQQDLINFAKNLSKMISAGLPAIRALEIIEKQARKGKFKSVVQNINDEVSKGTTLSDAMKMHPKVFSTLFVSMVKAGEESGNLSQALENVGLQMERTYLLKKKIRGAMMYPAVILVAMVIITILMLMFVVPTLTSTFEGLNVELPATTKFIIAISDFLRNNILITLFSVVAIFVMFGMWMRTKNGKRSFDFALLHFPILKGLTKEINSARTARTLSSLLSSGVEYTVAVDITKNVIQNSYYKDILDVAGDRIVKGGNISEVFEEYEKFYPLFVSEMASVGEETGKLSEMLFEVAKYYEEDVEQKTKDMSTVIEPVLMIVIGAAVGFFALSMMSPMYSLADKI